MPNKNYLKGVRKERKIVNECRAKGLIAFRSAGSHSPIDICVVDQKMRVIRFIQSKPSSMSESARKKLQDQYAILNGTFSVTFEVL